jgi:hypothetical protein
MKKEPTYSTEQVLEIVAAVARAAQSSGWDAADGTGQDLQTCEWRLTEQVRLALVLMKTRDSFADFLSFAELLALLEREKVTAGTLATFDRTVVREEGRKANRARRASQHVADAPTPPEPEDVQ